MEATTGRAACVRARRAEHPIAVPATTLLRLSASTLPTEAPATRPTQRRAGTCHVHQRVPHAGIRASTASWLTSSATPSVRSTPVPAIEVGQLLEPRRRNDDRCRNDRLEQLVGPRRALPGSSRSLSPCPGQPGVE
jgi:hypothetical protein